MDVTVLETQIPGYVGGTWEIDAGSFNVGFVIRHPMIANIRAQFESVHGEIFTADELLESSVAVTIDAASFRTSSEGTNK
jgi:polyisoprenoid-binding protein YceI